MAQQLVSKNGSPLIEIGQWVSDSGNAEYARLLEQHLAEMQASSFVADPAFKAMVEAFLAATNQEVVES